MEMSWVTGSILPQADRTAALQWTVSGSGIKQGGSPRSQDPLWDSEFNSTTWPRLLFAGLFRIQTYFYIKRSHSFVHQLCNIISFQAKNVNIKVYNQSTSYIFNKYQLKFHEFPYQDYSHNYLLLLFLILFYQLYCLLNIYQLFVHFSGLQ